MAQALILCAALWPSLANSQKASKPYPKDDIIFLLKGDVSPKRVEVLARERGIDFGLTPAIESELRQAGANDELVATLRELAPKPPAPPVLEIQSAPGHTQVYVDDAFSGQTSDKGRLKVPNLAPGNHRVRLSHDGYHDDERAVVLVDGQTTTVTVRLEAAKAPPSPASGENSRDDAGAGRGPYSVGGGVSGPVPIYKPVPPYSEEARKAKYTGTVVLRIVVGADGSVSSVRVVKPLGLGLDEKAVETVRTWKFRPCLRNGAPVACNVSLEVTFKLFK